MMIDSELFLTLLKQMVPLYLYVGIGYLAGKVLKIEGKNVALMIFYIVSPLVLFHAIAKLNISLALLSLFFVTFCISTFMGVSVHWLAGKWCKDQRKNVLALMAGTANTGYFGFPIAIYLLGEEGLGIYILAFLGMNFYENTVGFLLASHQAPNYVQDRTTLQRLARLPQLYSLFFGLLVAWLALPMPQLLESFFMNLRGSYIFLGMMIVGLGIAKMQHVELDARFMSISFAVRFIAWPLMTTSLVWLDATYTHLYDYAMRTSLVLLSIVPLASNSVSIATILGVHPDKVATTVLISTFFALLFVPVFIAFYF